jgi:hypothetical protein
VLQFFLHNRIDQHPRPLPNRQLETAATDRRLCFCSRLVLAILRHRVILRHPPPSERVSWFELRWMMTRFLLFHHTQDTTFNSRLGLSESDLLKAVVPGGMARQAAPDSKCVG